MPSRTLSVCIPTYRPDATFLRRALESLERQTVPIDAVIIRDDASGRFPRDVEEGSDLPIRLELGERRLGMAENWNAVVRSATTEWVLLLSQDDELHCTAVEALFSAIPLVPDAVAVSGLRTFIDEASRPITPRRHVNDRQYLFGEDGVYVLPPAETTYLTLRNGNVLGEPSSVIFRRTAFSEAGGYPPEYAHAADVELNIRLGQLGTWAFVTRPVLRRRLHTSNLTRENVRAGLHSADRARLLTAHLGRLRNDDALKVRTAAAAQFSRDIARSLIGRRWGSVRIAVTGLRMCRPVRVGGLIRYSTEVVTRRNQDCERLQRYRVGEVSPLGAGSP